MSIRVPIFMDAETWAHLKALANADLRTPHNFLQLLIWREWATQRSLVKETVSSQPGTGAAPAIPPTFHIHQGK